MAEVLGISRSQAYRLAKRLPFAVRIGDGPRPVIRIPRTALEQWVAEGGDASPRSTNEGKSGGPRVVTLPGSGGSARRTSAAAGPRSVSSARSNWKELFREK